MITIRSGTFLRRVLFVDALSCAGMGVMLAAFAEPLAALFALPLELVRETGWLLIPIALVLAVLASREHLPRVMVWAVIVMNALWTLQSCALLLTDWVAPNAAGVAFVLAQAAVTAVLAELEYRGLRSSAVPA